MLSRDRKADQAVLLGAAIAVAAAMGCANPCTDALIQHRQEQMSNFGRVWHSLEQRRSEQLARVGPGIAEQIQQRELALSQSLEQLEREVETRVLNWPREMASVRRALAVEMGRRPPTTCEIASAVY